MRYAADVVPNEGLCGDGVARAGRSGFGVIIASHTVRGLAVLRLGGRVEERWRGRETR